MPQNIETPQLGELDWSPDVRSASLNAVFEHATSCCAVAEQWYAAKRRSKRSWGRALRVMAIILGFLAAILPVIAEITTSRGKPGVAPGWAAVSLAGAAACVALDQYFGFSSAWMRFMIAEQRLSNQRERFQYAWNQHLIDVADPPTDDQTNALLTLARDSVTTVQAIIDKETSDWLADFRQVLTDSDKQLTSTAHQ